ncbi:hypothetical protein QNM99_04055 [Pseudomonas sp. PCH446]
MLLSLPCAWWLSGFGNHGLWISFLLFMTLRSLILGLYALKLRRNDGWFSQAAH